MNGASTVPIDSNQCSYRGDRSAIDVTQQWIPGILFHFLWNNPDYFGVWRTETTHNDNRTNDAREKFFVKRERKNS